MESWEEFSVAKQATFLRPRCLIFWKNSHDWKLGVSAGGAVETEGLQSFQINWNNWNNGNLAIFTWLFRGSRWFLHSTNYSSRGFGGSHWTIKVMAHFFMKAPSLPLHETGVCTHWSSQKLTTSNEDTSAKISKKPKVRLPFHQFHW